MCAGFITIRRIRRCRRTTVLFLWHRKRRRDTLRDWLLGPLRGHAAAIFDLRVLSFFLSRGFERDAGVLSWLLAAPRTCVRGLAGDRLPRLTTVHRAFHPPAEQHRHLRLLRCLLLHRSATRCCPVSRQLCGAWLLPLPAARSTVGNEFVAVARLLLFFLPFFFR